MIVVIAAKAKNNVIGKDNQLPWDIREDLKRFKEKTSGHPVIMGWNTFLSILQRSGKPLPNRIHFVLTKKKMFEIVQELSKEIGNKYPDFSLESFSGQIFFCNSFGAAVHKAEILDREVFVIGGERVYEEAIRSATKLELTELADDYEGDAFFPDFDQTKWRRTEHGNNSNDPSYQFVTYDRIAF